MKKAFLFSAILLLTARLSVAQDYQFTMGSSTYQDLVGPTVVSTPGWDDEVFAVNVPFTFAIYGTSGNTLDLEDGAVSNAAGEIFIFFDADLDDNGSSVISHQTEGVSPSRIFKIQWKNAGFVDGLPTDFVNYQLWIYEGNNRIELRYGTFTIAPAVFDPNTGPYVAINSTSSKSINPHGNPVNPSIRKDMGIILPLSAPPSNGTVYTFTPGFAAGITQVLPEAVTAGPNPFSGNLTMAISDPNNITTIALCDLHGKVMLEEKVISESQHSLNTEDLPAGIYMLMMSNGKELLRRKVVKE